MDIKIGMLVPRSYTVPLFTQQIVRGIKQGFEAKDITAQYFIEDIGKGVDPDLVMSKANNLLLNEVDIIFAVPGTKVDIPLVNLCDASQKPLINIDAGAAITRNDEMPSSPYVFTNSYDMWHACVLLGRYAGGLAGKRALATGAFFESGYSFLPAFEYGYKAQGGEIAGVHLCKEFKPEDFTMNLAGMIDNIKPDVLVAFYNGKDADDFYNYALKTGVTKGLPIVTTSLVSASVKEHTYPVSSALIWNAGVLHAGNKQFVEAYMARHKNMPDEYAAIAYESALVAASAIVEMDGDYFDGTEFCRILKHVTVEGPRGAFSFNPQTNKNWEFPTTIANNQQFTELTLMPDEVAHIRNYFAQWPHSGWYNPYPCA